MSLAVDPDSGFSGPIDVGAHPPQDGGGSGDSAVGDDGARDGAPPDDGGVAVGRLSVLLVNLETAAEHPTYPRSVRLGPYEDALAAQIAAVGAQVVVLLRLVPPAVCEGVEEMDPTRPCFEGRGLQVQRLLGDTYAVVCDARAETVCVGVSRGVGVEGVAPGAVSTDVGTTENLPAPPCDAAGGSCTEEACDDTTGVMAMDLQLETGAVRLVAIDANGSGTGAAGMFYLGTRCRTSQVGQAFGLVAEGPTLLVGDWAFEPDQMFQETETAVWSQHVGEAARFEDHDQREAGGGRVPTAESPPRALSHVVSDFAQGTCEVMVMPRIDEGFAFEEAEADGRLTHRAVRCELTWP